MMIGYILGAVVAPFLVWMLVWLGDEQARDDRKRHDQSWER